MDLLLPALLALPLAAAALIVAVSSVRRRHHSRVHGMTEPVHRAQAGTAAAQAAVVYPPAVTRRIRSGRERRAGSSHR